MKQINKLKNYLGRLILLFIVTVTLSNCQAEEDFFENNDPASIAYKEEIKRYLIELKLSTNKKKLDKVEDLSNAINPNSLKIYDLNSTQKVLIVDVNNLNGLETSFVTKAIFFLNKNKIIRSRLVTINDTDTVMDKNELILSVLNTAKDKKQYNGIVSSYNPFQEILQKNVYQNGKLVENQVLSSSSNNPNSKTNGCVAWYWVTTYASGQQTWSYLYTICSCEENTYRISCGGNGGGGSGSGPEFPANPEENKEVDYFSPEGEHIRYQFKNNVWRIVLMSLPEVVVKAKSSTYPYLIFNWPQDQRKVYNAGMVFTFESETNTWNGVLATDAIIAQAIEDNIDDSKLDPCIKEIMQKLKNITNSDIAKVLQKFEPSTTYNVTMKMGTVLPGNYAETIKVSKNNYLTTFTQDTYTSTTKLYRATALIHETIHAYLLSVVDDYNSYPTNAPFTDFPELFKIYVSKINFVNNANLAQHEDMANKYVGAIASALEEYQDSTTMIPSSLADKQVFLDMAWSGLRGTDVYNIKFPAGSADNTRITARIAAETIGVYSQGQYAVGKPCN
jgi:hypothetical protein